MEGWTKLAVMALSQLGVIPFGPVHRSSPAPLVDGVVTVVITGVMAMLAVIAAVGLLCAALWAGLEPQMGPVWTPALVALALIVLCLVLLLVMRLLVSRREPPAPPVVHPALDLDPEVLLTEAQRLVVQHKVPALLAAVVAGLIVGSPGSRPPRK
ncbi:hypothetical protein FBZ89_10294 [Nitrospirillum amazonense]|uniref:Uncharacterized protein n=1 Tax=Nitrospirillum amazonense TaxID=28077 RepID=A0A560FP74_9PROT|nr:hypothetical protein [Nitrospirillum amazonense]TWB23341.1 hypothetical protein FBZ89_10294 [Nitrospirillum amazonense]